MTSKVFVALRVAVDPSRAFDAFTRGIVSWWQPDPLFQITPQGDGELRFEPGVGGRLVTPACGWRDFRDRSDIRVGAR